MRKYTKWRKDALDTRLIRAAAVVLMGGHTPIYSIIKRLKSHPAMGDRTEQSIRQRLNRQRRLLDKQARDRVQSVESK